MYTKQKDRVIIFILDVLHFIVIRFMFLYRYHVRISPFNHCYFIPRTIFEIQSLVLFLKCYSETFFFMEWILVGDDKSYLLRLIYLL